MKIFKNKHGLSWGLGNTWVLSFKPTYIGKLFVTILDGNKRWVTGADLGRYLLGDPGCVHVYRYTEVMNYKNLYSRARINIATCNWPKYEENDRFSVFAKLRPTSSVHW